ncbi:CHRD domain-containing protein [Armatimonas sp.]|uniref:CHRD domain-containing protein n=1 Tax=Armatimonas sp. TaxID=1872638 RepID=UPI00286BEB32|nr:CHRD domain-containing protein [Armatimonas sp.]
MKTLFKALVLTATLALVTIPAQAAIKVYTAVLNGASEAPPVVSAGTGFTIVTVDDVLNTMRVQVTFTGLTGTTTVAHIHAPTAVAFTGTVGVASYPGTFPGFPAGVTSGTYDSGAIDMSLTSSFTPAFLTLGGGTAPGAFVLLQSSFAGGRAYLNVHSTFAPGGEIRGFLVAAPEPTPFVLMGLGGVAGLALRRRRRA